MQAFYDKKPQKLEEVGNGSYLYRWDIKEEPSTDGSDSKTKRVHYVCNEVTVWPPLSANRITAAVISELWGGDYENKLVNEYNSSVMGIYPKDVAKQKYDRYYDFLVERERVKAAVDADCVELEIK